MNAYDDETDDCEDGDCQNCGDDLLVEGAVYYDGQEIVCPSCKTVHWVCCDSETPVHLHGPVTEEP